MILLFDFILFFQIKWNLINAFYNIINFINWQEEQKCFQVFSCFFAAKVDHKIIKSVRVSMTIFLGQEINLEYLIVKCFVIKQTDMTKQILGYL